MESFSRYIFLPMVALYCLGKRWLPDMSIFEADLLLVLRKHGTIFPARYHAGSAVL